MFQVVLTRERYPSGIPSNPAGSVPKEHAQWIDDIISRLKNIKDAPKPDDAADRDAQRDYSEWGPRYKYKWPLQLYMNKHFAFKYAEGRLPGRAQEVLTLMWKLWQTHKFRLDFTNMRLALPGANINNIKVVSVGGGPAADLIAFHAFLTKIFSSNTLVHGTIIEVSDAWAEAVHAVLPRVQFVNADILGYMSRTSRGGPEVSKACKAIKEADVVLASHVLVDFGPADGTELFATLLDSFMKPGALFIAVDRWMPKCMEHLTRGVAQVTGLPGKPKTTAVSVVAGPQYARAAPPVDIDALLEMISGLNLQPATARGSSY